MQATKIHIESDKLPLRATGADFLVSGQVYTVHSKREVILSAGSFQLPQLLELSGIGSASLLREAGVDVFLENPNAGENLQDHLLVPLTYEAAPGEGTFESFRDTRMAAAASEEYRVNHTGPLASSTCNAYISISQLQSAIEIGKSDTSSRFTVLIND